MRCFDGFTPIRLWSVGFLVALGIGAVPTFGEPITTVALIIFLRWVYGRYLVRQRSIEAINHSGGAGGGGDEEGEQGIEKRDNEEFNFGFNDRDEEEDGEKTSFSTMSNFGSSTPVVLWDEPDLEVVVVRVDSVTVPKKEHLFFLDNLKVVLVVLLITAHVACAFGANGMFYFTLGAYPNIFQKVSSSTLALLQSFAVPLFFFVAGYLTPPSFERKGRDEFMLRRGCNLLIPAIIGCVVVVPVTIIVGQAMGGVKIFTFPHPGHFWIAIWLLLVYCMYSSIYDSITRLPVSISQLPSTLHRMLAGWWFCGVVMFLITLCYQLVGNEYFASMPLSLGSLTSILFMFYMGVIAYRNSWLEQPIRDQLDISIGFLRLVVIGEAALLVFLFQRTLSFTSDLELFTLVDAAYMVATFSVAGIFCLDASLVALDFFQQHLDFEIGVATFMLSISHVVYVIYPLVIAFLCWAFVAFYNRYLELEDVSSAKIVFQEEDFDYYYQSYAISKSVLVGPGNGALTLFMGFQAVLTMTHLLVWPLAWSLNKIFSQEKRRLIILILTLLPTPL